MKEAFFCLLLIIRVQSIFPGSNRKITVRDTDAVLARKTV